MKYEFKPLNLRPEWKWVAERAKCSLCEDTKGIVAYLGDKIVAIVALDSWSYNSVTIHIAVEDPYVFRHGFAEECFNYIFNTCGKGVLIGVTPANNEVALKFNRHVGLVEIYRISDGYDLGIDYVVQELRKEDCRYIEHGQEIHSNAA